MWVCVFSGVRKVLFVHEVLTLRELIIILHSISSRSCTRYGLQYTNNVAHFALLLAALNRRQKKRKHQDSSLDSEESDSDSSVKKKKSKKRRRRIKSSSSTENEDEV